jgi:hypothetical protein
MSTLEQIKSAYREMAVKARYRPAASSDGFGNITVPKAQLNLEEEAETYAQRWRKETDSCDFFIGKDEIYTRKAMIYAVEAARNMAAGRFGDKVALRLLKMAVAEMEQVIKKPEVKEVHRAIGR